MSLRRLADLALAAHHSPWRGAEPVGIDTRDRLFIKNGLLYLNSGTTVQVLSVLPGALLLKGYK